MDRKVCTPPKSERHPPPVVRMNATKYTPPTKRWADDLDEDTLPPLPPNLRRTESCPINEDNWTKVKTKKQSRDSR